MENVLKKIAVVSICSLMAMNSSLMNTKVFAEDDEMIVPLEINVDENENAEEEIAQKDDESENVYKQSIENEIEFEKSSIIDENVDDSKLDNEENLDFSLIADDQTRDEKCDEDNEPSNNMLFTFNLTAGNDSEQLYKKAKEVINDMRSLYSDSESPVVQTGVTKDTYADVIARCLAVYSSTNNLIELEDYMTLEDTMQSYSRIVSSMAALVNYGDVTKFAKYDANLFSDNQAFTDLYIKHMTNALDHMIDHAGIGLDFATEELCMAFILSKDVISSDIVNYWKNKLGEIKGTYFTGDEEGWYKISCLSQDNRASYVDGAEQIRDYLGLVDAEEYIDTSLSKIKRKFTTNGMFRDANTEVLQNPFLYDYTVRAHLTLVDYFGYDGLYSNELKEWLRKGGVSTLLLQASNGEIPYGGRSNQYIFNESLLASSCEYEAKYYKENGDDYLAGVFKRSAHIAIQSVYDWLDENKHIKNMMSDPNYGTDAYGNYDKYMVSTSSFLTIGYYFSDDSIQEEYCPAEIGGYVAHENELFNTVVANCKDYTVEILTVANNNYDSIGLGRIIKNGVPASLGLASSFCGKASYSIPKESKAWYSIDVAWENSTGDIVKLSDFNDKPQNRVLNSEVEIIKETNDEVEFWVTYSNDNMDGVDAVIEKYKLTNDGLFVSAQLVNPVSNNILFTVPLLDNNGDKENSIKTTIDESDNEVRVNYKNYSYVVSSDGSHINDDYKLYNRNGVYNASHFIKEGNVINVRFSLEEKSGEFDIKADDDKIYIELSNYNFDSKKASVYMMNPNEYHYLDTKRGYNTTSIIGKDDLIKIGEIILDGNTHTVSIDRIKDGVDLLYHKFYLADDTKIYQGPMWVTQIIGEKKSNEFINNDVLKGTGSNVFETAANNDFRVGFTKMVNANSCKSDLAMDYIWSDIDYTSGKTKYSPFVASNGKTYYYKSSGGTQNCTRLDNTLKQNASEGIGTTLIVTFRTGDKVPTSLIPQAAKETGKTGMVALDTSSQEGAENIIAFFEWIASTYGDCLEAIVLGNEIDFPKVWNYNYDFVGKGMPELEDYVEEYYRTLRLASLAVSRYVDDLPILVPFTHYWAGHGNDDNLPYNEDAEYSYAPKDILDVLFEKDNKQGNFNWGIAPHPYAISLLTPDPIGFDNDYLEYVTCKEDSTFLTFENIEVLDEYLHEESRLYNGKIRPVYLTESGIESYEVGSDRTDPSDERQEKQAASIAYIYFKSSLLESIKRWPYLHTTDGNDIWGGFYAHGSTFKDYATATPRLSLGVYKDIDTIDYKEFDKKYGSLISSLEIGEGISSYRELLVEAGNIFGSTYDWNKLWKQKNNIYDIEYDLDGGKAIGNPTEYEFDTETFMLNDPKKIGFKFVGWSGTDISGLSQNVEILKGSTGNKQYKANYEKVNNTVITEDLPSMAENESLTIDGIKYKIKDNSILLSNDYIPNSLVVYKQNKISTELHEVYPTNMKVYTFETDSGDYYLPVHQEELDDILTYAGASIRTIGEKGIRIITSIPTAKKNSLINEGINGFKVMEYGTLMCWASDLQDGEEPILIKQNDGKYLAKYGAKGRAYSREDSIYAIYKEANGITQYTNTLVGEYSDAQCASDFAMRSYMILRPTNAIDNSEDFVLYGGTLFRSISYVAYQNRNAFKPGTNAYEYIWKLIKAGYQDTYDSEYKKG